MRILKTVRIPKKDLKKLHRKFELEIYNKNLLILREICQKLCFVKLKIYEKSTNDQMSIFNYLPRIESIYYYDFDNNQIEIEEISNNQNKYYGIKTIGEEIDFYEILFINTNFGNICDFIFNKNVEITCSNWKNFLKYIDDL